MQPLGRRPIRFPHKTDYHFRRPHVNWWEVVNGNSANKALAKREADKEIQEEVNEFIQGEQDA